MHLRIVARAVLLVLFLGIRPTAIAQQYERVLVPFDTTQIEGANGVLWSTELRVRNEGDEEVSLFPEQCWFIGTPFPCSTKILVPAHTTQILRVLRAIGGSTRGLMLYVPLSRVDDVQFSLRVRDARSADSIGTAIPIVRARDLRSRYTIVGVPVTNDHRRTLRVYDAHLPEQAAFRIRVYDEADNRLLSDREYLAWGKTDPPNPVLVTATYDFSDALSGSALSGARSVSVSIERIFPEELPFWPMISTTSHLDHRVAIFVAH